MVSASSVDTMLESIKVLLKKVGPLIVVLAVTIIGWRLLSELASEARINGTLVDYTQALAWAKDLLGLAGILAGFLGVSTATLHPDLTPKAQAISAAGGLAGILAGATLLNVGGWPIPAALAAMAIGTITILIRKTW